MYTDKLIEEYVVEALQYANLSDADRQAAEKAFKAELINGPEKDIRYGNGQVFKKKVGSFDLDNFHKVYDKYYEENGLADIFNSDGKLIGSYVYSRFKDLDKKEPAIKYLGTLWGTQFKHEMEFLSDKIAKQEEENKKQLRLEEDKKLCEEIINEVKQLDDWKKLTKIYQENEVEEPNIKINIQRYDNNLSDYLYFSLTNIIMPPVYNGKYYWDEIDKFEKVDLADSNIAISLKNKIVGQIKNFLNKIIIDSEALFYLINNYKEWEKRPEAELCKKFNPVWMCYKINNKFYKAIICKLKVIDNKEELGIIFKDIDNEKSTAVKFDSSARIIAMRSEFNHTWGSYNDKSWQYKSLINLNYGEDVIKKLKIDLDPSNYSDPGGKHHNSVTSAPDEYKAFFTDIAIEEGESLWVD